MATSIPCRLNNNNSHNGQMRDNTEGLFHQILDFSYCDRYCGSGDLFLIEKLGENRAVKTSKFSEAEIRSILREGQGGASRAEVCKRHGISIPTFYAWRAKYGLHEDRARNPEGDIPDNKSSMTSTASVAVSPMNARIRELEAENQLLKRLFIEMALECEMLKRKVNSVSSAVS